MSVEIKRIPYHIPTYEPSKPGELPMFFEKKAYQGAEGRVYPVPYVDQLSNKPIDRAWDAVILKNEHIEVTLLPELGGKIHGAKDLHNNYEFIYQNTVIKPAMVGLAGPWVSGGVEFNWPQHHRPTTFMPLEATLLENEDGSKTCIMGEAEPFNRMRGQVAISVYPDSSVVEATATVYNRTDKPLPFMWWNNLAVRVDEKYKACFPPDVEWGNDHDRRAVISFPVMKGVYRTARPFDYGDGTDVTWYSGVKLPTSVMVSKGQSDMDFLGGYDFGRNAGTVTVSDHRYAPGKKMWTWGDGAFGHAWCANLTDNGDRYIELMTGTYTDNQPDFTWLMPGECRKFTQIWFPIHGIGAPMQASRDGALSFSVSDGQISVGAVSTREIQNAVLTLTCRGEELLRLTDTITPANCLLGTASMPADAKETDCTLTLSDANGHSILTYTPPVKGSKIPPKAREIPPRPKDVTSIEELYLHGAHLVQYKHHTYEAEDYFREALRRDPNDYRCNLEMGRLLTERADFEAAEAHLQKAVDRIKTRNDNPGDAESLYLLARVKKIRGDIDGAYNLCSDASWQYAWRSPSLYQIACIDTKRGNFARALESLDECIAGNARHYSARTLRAYLTKDTAALSAILSEVPQDVYARFALYFLSERPVEAFILSRPEDCLDAALDFAAAGLTKEAIGCLQLCTKSSALISFHLAHLTGETAAIGDMYLCYPNRLEDIAILDMENAKAQYLLGCLYYDRKNYEKAIAAWEKSLALDGSNAFAFRNLAFAYFDHKNNPAKAKELLEKALELAPHNARIVYELLQLYKNLLYTPADRLALLEKHADETRARDDCFLEKAILYTQLGKLEEAKALLLSKRFNIYEGGEGKLTRHHGWLYTMLGKKAQDAGDFETALDFYKNALIFPANYGEGRHYSAQEGNIYYYTGMLYRAMGDEANAVKAFESAANQPFYVSEMSYFAALANRALGRNDTAEDVLHNMLDTAEQKLANRDLYGYFGVGTPAPLPFESNIVRQNTIPALLLQVLAYNGLGDFAARDTALAELEAMDPHGTPLAFFKMLGILPGETV